MLPVKLGIFSMTPPAAPDDDGSYLRWHLLDHMPEQYSLPGIVLAHRWLADADLQAARLAGDGPLADLGALVEYYVAEPVEPTLDDFFGLARRLTEAGRFPERRPSLGLRMLALQQWYAAPQALVSAEVVPYRPHRGILLLVEEPTAAGADEWLRWVHDEHLPELLTVPGVAGAGLYRGAGPWSIPAPAAGPDVVFTIVYLDADPLATSAALAPVAEQRWASGAVRPLFAGPLRSMVEWEAWR
jgi:hypothetical protein